MKQELFWSLVVEPGWVQAAIWKIEEDSKSVSVVATGTPSPWGDNGDLVEATDTTLSVAVSKLPEDAKEPEKTVFGVSPDWIQDGAIKKEFLEKIKTISSKLSLVPTGFVVIPEAIAHLAKTQEGSPLSAVVIGLNNEALDVSLFNLGKLSGSTSVSRSVSVVDDLVEALTRLSPDQPLPSRLILYNGKEAQLEEVKQQMLAAHWSGFEKIKFLHTPKVEIIDPEKKVLSVSLAGASEIAEVSAITSAKEQVSAPNQEKSGEHKQEESKPEVLAPEDFGFAIGKDLKSHSEQPEFSKPEEKEHSKQKQKMKVSLKKPRVNPGKITGILGNVLPGKRALAVVGVVVVVFLVGGFGAWWFLPKAVVTIYIAPKKLEKETTLFVDPGAPGVNFDQAVIPGEIKQESTSGDKTTSTSGTKTVGERSSGSVTIRNGTSQSIQLSVGTQLFGPNNLGFTTQSSASISAAISPSSPGTSTLEVNAEDIGASYNLAKDETFKVSNFPKSDVDAVATGDFSGGTSREIASVSESDREDLEDELTQELVEGAQKSIEETVSADKIFISASTTSSPTSREFSHKVGDETSTLKLAMSVDVSGVVVSKDDLNSYIAELLRNQVPSGFVLREDQIDVEFSLVEVSDKGIWEVEASFTANLLPEVNPDEVTKKIVGKFPPVAQEYLSSIPGYTRAEIRLSPPLPGRLGSLPRVVKNISVEVSAER